MVFYFTGTGNSLYIAKQIEKDPVSIPQVMRKDPLEFPRKVLAWWLLSTGMRCRRW